MRRRLSRALAGVLSLGVLVSLAGCALIPSDGAIIAVTTSAAPRLDPASSSDSVTRTLSAQLYPLLLTREAGSTDLMLGIAESVERADDGTLTVTIPSGLTFANGNDLTASDVAFSLQRMKEIDPGSWSARALRTIDSIELVDDSTVVIRPRVSGDRTLSIVLAGAAGAIVDEQVFRAAELTPDDEILEGQPFAGDYTVASIDLPDSLRLEPNPDAEDSDTIAPVEMRFDVTPGEVAEQLHDGDVDVVWGRVPQELRAELSEQDSTVALWRTGNAMRWLVFNLGTQPFGTETDRANADRALAVRLAAADLIDRDALAALDPTGWAAWSAYLPESLGGEPSILAARSGDGEGGPDAAAARQRLRAAGVNTPVSLEIAASLDRDGERDAITLALVEQLESDGLFEVDLVDVEQSLKRGILARENYPAIDDAWVPLGVGVEDFLIPAYGEDSVFANSAESSALDDAIEQYAETRPADRESQLAVVQRLLATRAATIPLLARVESAFAGPRVTGGGFDGRGVLVFSSFLRP